MRGVVAVLLLWLHMAGALAQSFDCAKATIPAEYQICDEKQPDLRLYDTVLDNLFQQARLATGILENQILAEQQIWLKK